MLPNKQNREHVAFSRRGGDSVCNSDYARSAGDKWGKVFSALGIFLGKSHGGASPSNRPRRLGTHGAKGGRKWRKSPRKGERLAVRSSDTP